jgi:microcystin-dependent protein
MSDPFLGEVKIFTGDYAPKAWAMCNGQFLPINQNQPLFSILGTMYGGNGQTTFALPDFRGRVPIHWGRSFQTPGQRGGEEFHTVSQSEMPAHNHFIQSAGNNDGDTATPTGNLFGKSGSQPYQSSPVSLTTLHPSSITSTGGSQAHENRQPYLVLNFIISLQGIFPSRD